jgi:hypothetical protein
VAKSHRDKVDDEIRRRMSNIAAAAGVSRGRIELEVLFLLPPEFVREYSRLFRAALDDPVTSGDGGKDEGRIKAKGTARDEMKTRSMSGAKTGGKRFVAGHWPVRSEKAIDAKRKLDKRLVRSVEDALVEAGLTGAASVRKFTDGTAAARCDQCGRFLRDDWIRCPFHA